MDASRAAGFRRSFQPKSWPFWSIHLIAVGGVIVSGWSWSGLLLAAALYYVRMFFVTAGYHRYFSHRAFKTSRPFQFLLAVGAESAAQKGVLWWAGHHRRHHKYSDKEGDIHSVKLDGWWWSHVGWITGSVPEFDRPDLANVKDLARFPELRWIDRHNMLPPIALAVVLALVGGWHALLWGFFVSTVLLWHGSFSINSLAHLIGRRRYATGDESRNSFWLAVITCGEGWHNNHHHYMTSANQGWFWYEIDFSYYVIRALGWMGLVWDIRVPPAHVVRGEPRAERAPAPELDLPRAEPSVSRESGMRNAA
jgi:stearoyl-CoA desaturase (delta-9 desaturase)